MHELAICLGISESNLRARLEDEREKFDYNIETDPVKAKAEPKIRKVLFRDIYEMGRANACASLRRRQFEKAMGGDTTMLIYLGKQLLGQRDIIETKNLTTIEGAIGREGLKRLTPEQLAQQEEILLTAQGLKKNERDESKTSTGDGGNVGSASGVAVDSEGRASGAVPEEPEILH